MVALYVLCSLIYFSPRCGKALAFLFFIHAFSNILSRQPVRWDDMHCELEARASVASRIPPSMDIEWECRENTFSFPLPLFKNDLTHSRPKICLDLGAQKIGSLILTLRMAYVLQLQTEFLFELPKQQCNAVPNAFPNNIQTHSIRIQLMPTLMLFNNIVRRRGKGKGLLLPSCNALGVLLFPF